jgi:hypothetical protein
LKLYIDALTMFGITFFFGIEFSTYIITGCPYKEANGEYVKDGPHSYSYTNSGVTSQMYRQSEEAWALSMNGRIACRKTDPSDVPPSSGWEYWKASPGAYTPAEKMEVQPGTPVSLQPQASVPAPSVAVAASAPDTTPLPAKADTVPSTQPTPAAATAATAAAVPSPRPPQGKEVAN